jgi:hypothetical protein
VGTCDANGERVRIAISGTHCSGKSTLVDDFLAVQPQYVHEPEPYDALELYGESSGEEPTAADFYRQLELSVETLRGYGPGTRVIAERSPLDFVAYILALRGRDRIEAAIELASRGMEHLDLLVILPLNDADGIDAPESEDLELRETMNDHLLDIITTDEFDLLGGLRVIEVQGSRRRRLALLKGAIDR